MPSARPNSTPERETAALAAVYRFVLACHAKKKAAPTSRPEDAMKGSKDDRATDSISEE